MRKIFQYLIIIPFTILACGKDGNIPCIVQGEKRDTTSFSETHAARASAYVDKYWMGNAYFVMDTMYITLIDTTNLNRDSSWYRKNVLDSASHNIFLYAFEKDRDDPARWRNLHFLFEIMFASYPKRDTSLYFHYPLKPYKYPS